MTACRRCAAALVLALLVAVAGVAETIDPVPSPDEESLAAAEQAFADAFARRDREAFAAFLHPQTTFMGAQGPLRGPQAVMEVWGSMLEAAEAPFSWRPARVMVAPDGGLGMTTGPVFAPSGEQVGAFASTWQRQEDGTWRVLFDMAPPCPSCSPPPAPGADPPTAAEPNLDPVPNPEPDPSPSGAD